MSLCRWNYHEESEAGINRLINLDLCLSYTYQMMVWIVKRTANHSLLMLHIILSLHYILTITVFQSFHFAGSDLALHNFAAFFKKLSEEERGNVKKLMKFQNKRGGRICLQQLKVSRLTNRGLEKLDQQQNHIVHIHRSLWLIEYYGIVPPPLLLWHIHVPTTSMPSYL